MKKHVLDRITKQQVALAKLQPLPHELEEQLQDWYKVELTYSSNAIEGSTLTRLETAQVIEKGIQSIIPGKTLREQIEALQHGKAIDFVTDLVARGFKSQYNPIDERIILGIHRLVLTGGDDLWAGRYRETEVVVSGTDYTFPKATAVPYQMTEFIHWLNDNRSLHPVQLAADAHFKLVTIHPFVDGNGRTARLLMTLILGYNDYPPAIIRSDMRTEYLEAVRQGQTDDDLTAFYALIAEAVERSIAKYRSIVLGEPFDYRAKAASKSQKPLLKIGELARATNESVATIRHWTSAGLLTVERAGRPSRLYHQSMIDRVNTIRQLQKDRRLSLTEIRDLFSKQQAA